MIAYFFLAFLIVGAVAFFNYKHLISKGKSTQDAANETMNSTAPLLLSVLSLGFLRGIFPQNNAINNDINISDLNNHHDSGGFNFMPWVVVGALAILGTLSII